MKHDSVTFLNKMDIFIISELFLNSLWWLVMSLTLTFNLDQSKQRRFLEASDWSVETTRYC